MRNAFCSTLLESTANPAFVFLTGDLGFQALEPLRQVMGERFINAGIAEQNMVSVAAGLAKAGLRPWVYSIAPFLYAGAFEQIRNDVCLHNMPESWSGTVAATVMASWAALIMQSTLLLGFHRRVGC